MAKGSVRKKGNKWYYRFYVEDESGRRVQREFAGTQSKKATEALLRKAIDDYETMQFVACCEQLTLHDLLEKWLEEAVKPGSYRNGTAATYQSTARRIERHPISERRIRALTPEHLQSYINLLTVGGTYPDGSAVKPLGRSSLNVYYTVLSGALQFAVFPKRYLLHVLRHTYTSNLLAKGASVKEVQDLLGHANSTITLNVYAHADASGKRAAAHLLDMLE